MGWKWSSDAIDELKNQDAYKASRQNLLEEIAGCDASILGLRSTTADSTPVKGGGSGREDRLINYIVRRQRLAENLEQIELNIKLTERAFSVLTTEERMILDRFFIHHERGAEERIAGELGVDPRTVRRKRREALEHFTIARFGSRQ